MTQESTVFVVASIVEESSDLSLAELCRACAVPAERIFELVDEGLVEPFGQSPARWRFSGISVRRVRCALRLEQDLGINVAGAALALDLLEEIARLRARLKRFDD